MPDTIRARLLLLMMTVLLPAIAAALFVVARTYQGERDAVQRNMRDGARTFVQVINRELARRADIARVMATSGLVADSADPAGPDPLVFHAWALRAAQDLGGWIELHSATAVLVDTRWPAGSAPRPHRAGFRLADVAAFTPLAPQPPDAGLSARVVQPVLRNGRARLNLVIAVPPEVMQRVLDDLGLPGNWVGTVMDNRHQVVARHPGGAAYVGRPATADLRASIGTSNEGEFRSVTLDGVPVQGYFSRTPQGWTYLSASPLGEVTENLPAAVLTVVLAALALLGGAAAGAVVVARGIAGAVESLKRGAQALQADAPVAISPTGIVECDEVAATLARAAQAIANARHELERQVADAVNATRVAEQRVAEAQRIAALGRLTGGVAHDFNNLLGVISNSAHLIERHAQTPALQMPVAATLRAVEVGSHLSQQLLRFGARQPVSPRPIDLARYLPDLLEMLQMVVRKNITVHIEVQRGTHQVKVDLSELELALINLALNARDALPKGGQLWVEARTAADDEIAPLPAGAYVLLTITDDGVGMAEAVAAQVFEPFFTTKDVGQGTGLGLSQVHGFCMQAGGLARMASTPGLGSTVSLLLPASEPAAALAHAPALPIMAAAADHRPQAGGALAGTRVLLVEDNNELAEVTGLLLESYGCIVRRASHVEDALAQFHSGDAIDLVLTDVVMPGGRNGIDLAQELRRCRPNLPVVLISGYSAALNRLTGFTVLRKPVAADHLVNTLVAALHGTAPPTETPG